MSVRQSASGAGLRRSATTPAGGPWSMFCRHYPTTINNFGAWLAFVATGNGNQSILQHNGTAATMLVAGNTTSAAFGNVVTSRWHDACLTGTGTGAGATLTGYVARTGDSAAAASGTASGLSIALSPALWVGDGTGGEVFTGSLADLMVWTVVLTASEVEQQRTSRVPCVRLDKLWAWVPAPNAQSLLHDWSGNARPFTTTSTATFDDPVLVDAVPAWDRVSRHAMAVIGGGGGGFQAAWARGCNHVLMPGVLAA